MFKKILSITMIASFLGLNTIPCMAACETARTEHLDVHKKAPCNLVDITDSSKTIEKGNVLQFVYDEKFFSKKANTGDIVHFEVPQAIYTREGTMLIPANSKITAEVTQIEKPKWFNKNARVSLFFRNLVLPDGTCYELKARPFTEDYKLKEGPWTTAGKLIASTLTMGAVGAGAGVGFAFIPTPAKIGTGLAVGIPIGCSVGLVLGLVTPGCHYKTRKGEAVYAVLLDELKICK